MRMTLMNQSASPRETLGPSLAESMWTACEILGPLRPESKDNMPRKWPNSVQEMAATRALASWLFHAPVIKKRLPENLLGEPSSHG